MESTTPKAWLIPWENTGLCPNVINLRKTNYQTLPNPSLFLKRGAKKSPSLAKEGLDKIKFLDFSLSYAELFRGRLVI